MKWWIIYRFAVVLRGTLSRSSCTLAVSLAFSRGTAFMQIHQTAFDSEFPGNSAEVGVPTDNNFRVDSPKHAYSITDPEIDAYRDPSTLMMSCRGRNALWRCGVPFSQFLWIRPAREGEGREGRCIETNPLEPKRNRFVIERRRWSIIIGCEGEIVRRGWMNGPGIRCNQGTVTYYGQHMVLQRRIWACCARPRDWIRTQQRSVNSLEWELENLPFVGDKSDFSCNYRVLPTRMKRGSFGLFMSLILLQAATIRHTIVTNRRTWV